MPGRFVDLVRRAALPLAIGLMLTTSASGPAQTYTWNGPTTGNFSDSTKWPLTGPPPAAGSASTVLQFFVANGHTATHDLDADLNLNRMEFNNRGSLAFVLNRPATGAGAASRFVFGGTDPAIVQAGNGEITFTNPSTTAVPMVLGADVTVGGSGLGSILIGSPLSGPGRFVVTGGAPTVNTRVVGLSNANTANVNSFGGVVLDGGNLSIGSSPSVLGGTTGNLTTLNVTANGGTLASSAANDGLLSNINVAAGGRLTMVGLSPTLTLAPTAVISGAGNLSLRSAGGLVVPSASTLSGVVTIDTPVLGAGAASAPTELTLIQAAGSLLNVPEFNVRGGGILNLDSNDAGGANSNRIGDTAAVNLRFGLLELLGSPGVSVNEVAGPLLGAGYSTVTVLTGGTITANTGTARDVSLSFASLARDERGTFLFRGTNFGLAPTGGNGGGTTARLLFAAAPTADLVGGGGAAGTTTVSILPYAIGTTTTSATTASTTNAGLVTYGANGVRPLNLTTEYAAALTAGATSNVRLTAATANNAALTVNALVVAVASTTAVTGTGTVRVTSGTVLNTSAATVTNGLSFLGAEANIFTNSTLTLNGPLTGSNGLTKSGTSGLVLGGDNTGLTGSLTINDGRITVAAANQLPGTGGIVVNGSIAGSTSAGLTYTGAAPVDVARDIAINTGYVNFATAMGAGPLTLSGVISGPGGVAITGSATTAPIALAGNNLYTGPTRISSGTLLIDGDAALGNGGSLSFGTSTTGGLLLAGDWTTARHIELDSAGRVDTGGFAATWNGLVTGDTTLTKAGAGRLQINTSNPFDGGVTVANNGGEVRLTRDGQLNSTTYTLNNDGTLVLDNTELPSPGPIGMAPVVVDRVSDGATVSVSAGGTLQVIGNGLRTVTERIGRLTGPTTEGVEGTLEVQSLNGQLTVVRIGNLTVTNGTVLVRGTGLAQTSGAASQVFLDQFNSVNVISGQTLPGVFAENLLNPGVIETAVYDPAVGIRQSGPIDFPDGPVIQNPANGGTTPTTANFQVSTAFTAPSGAPNNTDTVGAANTIVSLRLTPGARLNASSGTLTVSTGNFLTEAGAGTATIAGGTLTTGIANTTTGANNVLAFATNSDLVVGAVLTGNAGLAKLGAGTLTLTAANTFTGAITVNAGTLAFGPGGGLVGGTTAPNNLALVAGATVNLNGISQTIGTLTGTVPAGSPTSVVQLGAATLTVASPTSGGIFAGRIDGTGGLVKRGTGTLTLSGTTANTYSGGTRIEVGTVSVADVARLGTGALTLAGGTLTYSGTTAANLPGLAIESAGGTVNTSSSTAGAGLNVPAGFTWNGPLTKSGSGRLVFPGAINTAQPLTVTAGTLVAGGPVSLGTLTVSGGTVQTGGNPLTAGTLTMSSGAVQTGGGTVNVTTLTLTGGTITTGNAAATAGAMTGSTGGTVDVGTSTFTPNSLSFGTSVLGIGGTLALPTGTFTPTGAAQTIAANITGATSINYTPFVSGTASGLLTLGGTNTFTGGLTGSGSARFNLTNPAGFGTGQVVFNTELADTQPDLQFTLGAGPSVVANNIRLTANGGLATVFSVGSASSSVELTGVISGGAPSTPDNLTQTRLQVNGTDSATTGTAVKFTNPANSFQAIIEVQDGTLAVENNATLGLAENVVRLNNATATARTGLRFDADFTGANAFPRTIAMLGASSINTQGFSVILNGPVVDAITPPTGVGTGLVTSTGDDLTKIGTGTLTLASTANTFSGLLTVNEGSVVVTGNVLAGFAAADIVAVNTTGRLSGTGTINRSVNLNAGGILQGGVGAAAGSLSVSAVTLDGANALRAVVGGPATTPSASLVAAGGALGVNAAGAATDLTTIVLVNDGTLTLDPTGTTTYTVTVATFGSTTAVPANFAVASENFLFSSASVLVNPTNIQVMFTPVPEPATLLAVGAAGLFAAAAVRRRLKPVV